MFRSLLRNKFPLSNPHLRPRIKDPWERHHAWQKDPRNSKFTIKEIFPGLGTAIVLFSLYCGYDYKFGTHDSHGH